MNRPTYGSDNPNQTWLNLTRDGVVYARRQGKNGPEVQVYYSDRDLLSNWLPIKNTGSAGAVFHYCPRVGDAVTVSHYGTGIEQGVVVGSHPTDNNPGISPNSLDSVAMATEDGAFFEHEPNSGTTTLAGVGTLHLSVKGETLAFSGPWTLNASGTVQITAPLIILKSNVQITGTLFCDYYEGYQGEPVATPHIRNADGSGAGA